MPPPNIWVRNLTTGHELTDRISGLNWSSVRNGGDETCTFEYHASWFAANPEIEPGSVIAVGDRLDVLWQGRIEEPDRGGEDDETITVTAYGRGIALKDDTFTEVFVDHDLSAWGEVSAARKIVVRLFGDSPERNLTVEPDEAGGAPRLSMLISGQFDDTTAETLYDAGAGNVITRLYIGAVSRIGLVADEFLTAVPAAWADDNAGSEEVGSDYESASSITFDPATPQRYVVLRWDWTGTGPAGVDGGDYGFAYGGVAAYGGHGLIGQGTPTATRGSGFLASQIIANIVERVSELTIRRIDATSFVIYQSAFKTPTIHEEGVAETNRFHAHERTWGTWGPEGVLDGLGEAFFDYTALEPDTQHWVASRADCDGVGLQTERSSLYNTVHVSYTDEGGVSRTVTRTRYVPELGSRTRSKTLPAGQMVTEAAEALGDAFLALYGAFAPARGTVTISAPITHYRRGRLEPHHMRADGANLRIPDVLPSTTMFELDTDPDRRTTFPINRVRVDAGGEVAKVTAELDQTHDALSVLLARTEQSTELIAA